MLPSATATAHSLARQYEKNLGTGMHRAFLFIWVFFLCFLVYKNEIISFFLDALVGSVIIEFTLSSRGTFGRCEIEEISSSTKNTTSDQRIPLLVWFTPSTFIFLFFVFLSKQKTRLAFTRWIIARLFHHFLPSLSKRSYLQPDVI